MTMRVMDAAQIEAATPWGRLVDSIADGVASGGIGGPERQVLPMEGPGDTTSSLLVMPAWDTAIAGGGVIGVKLVTYVPANGIIGAPTIHAVYVLFDRVTGAPMALLDGEALTCRRTAAISALGSRLLARPDGDRLLVVGTGQLVPSIVSAHVDVCGAQRVEIWGRSEQRSAEAAARVRATVAVPVEQAVDLRAAVERADVVVCATASSAPLVLGSWVRPGTHLSLLGSFRPDMRETDDELIARAMVVVDSLPEALQSGDLAEPIRSGAIVADHVSGDLSALINGCLDGRATREFSAHDGISVFKSVGFAAADLLTARLAVSP